MNTISAAYKHTTKCKEIISFAFKVTLVTYFYDCSNQFEVKCAPLCSLTLLGHQKNEQLSELKIVVESVITGYGENEDLCVAS